MTRPDAIAELTLEERKVRDAAFWRTIFWSFFDVRDSQKVDEVMCHMATGVDEQFQWVSRTPKETVARVISEVARMRKEAASRSEIMTDPEVYLAFRKAADVPMSAAENERSPEIEAFFILSAMMGGDPKGELPF